jgi:hypothetical protein
MTMKRLLLLPLLSISFFAGAQGHKLEKIGETAAILNVPESVLPDLKNGIFYVSLIDGAGWDADGKGGIGILGPGMEKYDSTWITGLNAPKGMGIVGNRLFVADMTTVVVIDIKKGSIEKKIAIDSAQGLNDITVNSDGIVFVSDSRTGRIWKIENDKPSLYLENLKGINGLKSVGTDLYIGAGKQFVKAGRDKKLATLAEVTQGIDGIEPVGNGDFILTAWPGYIYYVSANGAVETLLETHADKVNSADIGYDPEKKILYVPTFNARKIVMYRVL